MSNTNPECAETPFGTGPTRWGEVIEPYPVSPSDIDASSHLYNAFGHTETEISAGHIVRFCQERGSWGPFTRREIEEFYNRSGHKDFWFNRLVDPGIAYDIRRGNYRTGGGWVIHDVETDSFTVTTEFVERCHASSQSKKEPSQ